MWFASFLRCMKRNRWIVAIVGVAAFLGICWALTPPPPIVFPNVQEACVRVTAAGFHCTSDREDGVTANGFLVTQEETDWRVVNVLWKIGKMGPEWKGKVWVTFSTDQLALCGIPNGAASRSWGVVCAYGDADLLNQIECSLRRAALPSRPWSTMDGSGEPSHCLKSSLCSHSSSESLTITGSAFRHNQAVGGNYSTAAVRPGLGAGGAILSGGRDGTGAKLVVSASTFDHNQPLIVAVPPERKMPPPNASRGSMFTRENGWLNDNDLADLADAGVRFLVVHVGTPLSFATCRCPVSRSASSIVAR